MIEFWTIFMAALSSVSCALLGCFLFVRRMSMLGDAISHSVLPGLVLAFLLTGSLNSIAIIIGAIILGVLTAFLSQAIHDVTEIAEDASMGLVFTTMFSIGVILITRYADLVDLDPGCVLYGSLETSIFKKSAFFSLRVPSGVLTLLPVLFATIGFVVLFWKELKLVSFDPALAAAMGFRVSIVHYALMAMISTVTVVSFEVVGSILVIAMLIVPAATASLLTQRLLGMMFWSSSIAVISAISGYYAAVWTNTSIAGMITVAQGVIFGMIAILMPRRSKAIEQRAPETEVISG